MYCFKIFYTLKPSTHIKINFKNYSNMFRSHWTIIREYVVPNSAGYTSTVEHGHNLTPHTSMLQQNHSVTY